MTKQILLTVFSFLTLLINAQDENKVTLSGSIKDAENNEPLIGATVVVKTGVGTVADLDGNFKIKVDKGDYNIEVSMLGYRKFTQKIKLYANKSVEIKLESDVLDEVEIVADMAKIRETPVAFSAISSTKIQEELGGKDISMIANTTPGAYASSSGGGAGDSRVTLRGFDQRNIAVMVDGIPVNDMENGQVYWSNWDGLKDITKSMQIQRGLGASKLAVSSVGGTMNFITNGINDKQQLVVKKEWGNNRHNMMGLSYNSGIINNKWGFTLAGTYKSGDGWVDNTWTDAYSYFAKVQFMPNPRHIISIGANGAPQSHGQRTTKLPIAVYDRKLSDKLGANTDSTLNAITYSPSTIRYVTTKSKGDRDLRWNPDQGYLNGSPVNDKINFYHKPLFNLNHFWKISEKTTLSTVAYASFGKGGGTSYSPTYTSRDSTTGYYNIQSKYNSNASFIDPSISTTESKSTLILRASNNNHNWYGILSTATTKLNQQFNITYGVDLRYYKGIHTQTVYDLLGGDYFVEGGTNKNPNLDGTNNQNFIKRKDDIFGRNYTGLVKWGGLFLQGEYKKDKWAAFLTVTGSYSGYNRIDYYRPKDLVLSDTTFYNAVSYNTIINYNGATYDKNSEGIRDATTGWKWQLGYTIKGGANYNINEHHNVFVNIGVLQIPQKFDNVFTFGNEVAKDFKPQNVQSNELGYGLKYGKFNVNFNGYYTTWANQPQRTVTGPDGETYNVNGINLVYKGIEFEATYKPIKQIEIEGILSLGDWRYNSASTIIVNDENGVPQLTYDFDAKGIKIGDAAQKQFGLATRFMPFKGFYLKPRYTYFADNYANFFALDLIGTNKRRQSWKMPNYGLLDISLGYELSFTGFKVNLYSTINNALNTRYINDAQNNGFGSGFNATSATVFFGAGRTFIFGTKLTF